MDYEAMVKAIWRHSLPTTSDGTGQRQELIRYATLAASGHNTQCWRFRLEEDAIVILPDLARRTPVVDPDDHHLYVSLGCAAENLSLAARAQGLTGSVTFHPEGAGKVIVALRPGQREVSPLFDAITTRQCTRSEYDGRPLLDEELRLLQTAGTGRGVAVNLLTGRDDIEVALGYILRANAMQLNDPAFRQELERWIRFDDSEATEKRDGLSARVTGNPRTPRWLGKFLLRLALRAKPENDKVARQVRSSSGLAVFVSAQDDRAHWVEAGRCYQRFALQATALGIRNAFVNQPVEAGEVRPEFARALGLDAGRPDLVVRFGRGPEMPRSLRRPVDSVLILPQRPS